MKSHKSELRFGHKLKFTLSYEISRFFIQFYSESRFLIAHVLLFGKMLVVTLPIVNLINEIKSDYILLLILIKEYKSRKRSMPTNFSMDPDKTR